MIIGILNKITTPEIEITAVPQNVDIVCLNAHHEEDLQNYDLTKFDSVIISYKFKLSKATIDCLTNCKAIVCASVGFDNVDYRYAALKGIKVFNVPDYGTNDVADHTMALLLSYVRRITAYNSFIKMDATKNWNPHIVSSFHRLANKNIGIIGLGRIGTAVALRAKAFGLNVLFYDPYKPNGYDKTFQFIKVNSLSELVMKSDIISIHAPLTAETEGMFRWESIRVAKRHPIIINTARGRIVDNFGICQALKDDIIEAFLVDVLETEPPKSNEELVVMQKEGAYTDRIISESLL